MFNNWLLLYIVYNICFYLSRKHKVNSTFLEYRIDHFKGQVDDFSMPARIIILLYVRRCNQHFICDQENCASMHCRRSILGCQFIKYTILSLKRITVAVFIFLAVICTFFFQIRLFPHSSAFSCNNNGVTQTTLSNLHNFPILRRLNCELAPCLRLHVTSRTLTRHLSGFLPIRFVIFSLT